MAGKTYYWSSNGKCYHESLACPHLKNVRQPLCGNLQLAKRGGRSPCSHCCTTSYAIVPSVNADQDIDHSVLYVSDGSPLYHISPECNYFKYNKTKYRTTKQGAIASGHIRPCAVCAYSWPVLSDVYYTIPELPLQSSAPAQEPAEENHADSHSEENVEKKKESQNIDGTTALKSFGIGLFSFFMILFFAVMTLSLENSSGAKANTTSSPVKSQTSKPTPTRTPRPSFTPSPNESDRVTYTVTASAKMLESHSVGNDWSYYFEIDGKQIDKDRGVAINVKKGTSIPFYVEIMENDSYDDIGTCIGRIDSSDGSFYVDDIYVTVTETNGRYAGNTAKFQVKYSFAKS